MRILHVIPALASRYGGPSAAVVAMCRSLNQAGVSTLIAATDADGSGRLGVPLEIEVSHQGATAIFFHRQFSESLKWAGRLGDWLHAHVAEFDAVHVHAVFSYSSLVCGKACVRHGVPYVLRPLGTLDPWSVSRHRARKRVFLQVGGRRLLLNAAAMHYTSAEEQRLAETDRHGLPPGTVVPLGIDDEAFDVHPVASHDQEPFVLSMSRLDPKKGIELLIDAFHAASSAAPVWPLVIAGDGDTAYASQLRRRAAAGPAADYIRFVGWIEGDQKRRLLSDACLFVSPSHQENFGIGLSEAMAAGVPVMAAPGVNLAAEIAAAGAGWMVEQNSSAWTLALQNAMRHPGECRTRGSAARRFAERFRWSTVSRQLVAMYEAAIQNPRAARPPADLARSTAHAARST